MSVKKFFQGADITPVYSSTRIIFWFIFIGGVVLFQNFSASYTSFLSVVRQQKPFDSLKELYEKDEYIAGVPEGWTTKDILKVKKILSQ